jgi:hypothetical protein
VYGKEEVVPLDYLVPSVCIEAITNMTKEDVVHERLDQLMEIEEDRILAGFHQEVQRTESNGYREKWATTGQTSLGFSVVGPRARTR